VEVALHRYAEKATNARYYGYELEMSWWKNGNFRKLLEELPEYLIAILQPFRAVLAAIDKQLRETTAREGGKGGGRGQAKSRGQI